VYYDEYEISIGREIALCRRMIGKLKKTVEAREKQYGASAEALHRSLPKPQSPNEQRDFRKWSEDLQQLEVWQRRLGEYEKALQMVKQL
jgi:hypothetical protein